MRVSINGRSIELPEGYGIVEGGEYSYCEDCKMPFKSYRDKAECGIHWRPKSGTKYGFPLEDGTNCPRDGWDIVYSDK